MDFPRRFALQRAQIWLSNALVAVGLGLLVLTGGLYLDGEWERATFERQQAVRDQIDAATATAETLAAAVDAAERRGRATATALAQPTATAIPTPGPAGAPVVVAPPSPTATETIAPTATPRPNPTPVTIRRIVAPRIQLDSPVVVSKIENGEWQVPKFVAGHLEGTSSPGMGGNIVLSGHVQSISSGNVFARLDELKIGDVVTLRTSGGDIAYAITGRNVVVNTDISVVQSSGREELTLITCIGTFNPLTRDYSHRLVVWGERAA